MYSKEDFVQVIRENENIIYKVTTIYSFNEQDRKDLFQEIVLQLWRAYGKFRNESKISTWIYRIALNTAVSGFRKHKKDLAWVPINREVLNYSETQTTGYEDRLRTLYQCIESLNEMDKGLILLYLEDKSHEEIGEITGMTTTNISTRLFRIRNKLKSIVNNQKK